MQFEFLRAKDQDGLYEIYDVTPVDIEGVENWADYIIKEREACNNNAKITSEYCDSYMHMHAQGCPKYDDQVEDILGPQECIEDMAFKAVKRKHGLKKLYLLKQCARNPHKANGLGTLDGMAQDSCIYNTKYASTAVLVIVTGLTLVLQGPHCTTTWQALQPLQRKRKNERYTNGNGMAG